jgi:hypothetical protein
MPPWEKWFRYPGNICIIWNRDPTLSSEKTRKVVPITGVY